MHVSFRFNGLDVDASVDHDPGVRTFPNGDPGYPGSTDVEIGTIRVSDLETFLEYLSEEVGPEACLSMVQQRGGILIGKKLPAHIEDMLVYKWGDSMIETAEEVAQDEASEEYDPSLDW